MYFAEIRLKHNNGETSRIDSGFIRDEKHALNIARDFSPRLRKKDIEIIRMGV